MKRILVYIAIACLGIGLRLYKFSQPIADWHSWRQADTAAVARNFLRFGTDPLRPRYDDLSNIQTGQDNPNGYRMVEFPIYQTIAAELARRVGTYSIESWLRIVNIAMSAGTIIALGLLVDGLSGFWIGAVSAATYAVLPYSIYYGRTILPDTFMVFWAVVSLLIVSRTKKFAGLLAAAVCASVAMLAKPMAAFLFIPIPYLLWRNVRVSKRFWVYGLAFAAVSLVPLYAWRQWILQFPEGIAVNTWLLNGNGIRFKGAWFYWLFAKRLGELILGYTGYMLFGLGLVNPSKGKPVLLLMGAAVLLYFVIFATGNVQHDYYQILTIPFVSAAVAYGAVRMWRETRWIGPMVAICAYLGMLAFSWYTIHTYYWINHPEIVEAGRVADGMLPRDAKVIAPYNGDTTFLYQTGRQGWPIGFEIEKKIAMGATHYVTVSPTDNDGETRDLASRFTVLVRNDRFAVIDLTRPTHK